MKNRIALIPARGGSKRLPRKNILSFMGKPIIAWSIEAALNTGCFKKVVVSTEDTEIAVIAKSFGAEVDVRKESLAKDNISVAEVCLDFLKNQTRKGIYFKEMAVLYATAPLRDADDILKTLNLLDEESCNFSLAATEYDLPPHQALIEEGNKFVKPMWPDLVTKNSTDVNHFIVDNGSTYAVNVEAFLKEKDFYGRGLRAHIMPRHKSVDINEDIDFKIAELYAKEFCKIL